MQSLLLLQQEVSGLGHETGLCFVKSASLAGMNCQPRGLQAAPPTGPHTDGVALRKVKSAGPR
jgi:hypothetical protein